MSEAGGRVADIFTTPDAGAAPAHRDRVRTTKGRGIEGDRYASGTGTWSAHPGGGRHLTLIAQEDLDAVARDTGIRLGAAESRRNVLTQGIVVGDLVGKQFWIGTTLCVGIRLCEPCAYLESKTRPGVMAAFVHRAGLRAEILESGEIAVGDAIRVAAGVPASGLTA
jgi:MOSC domain-containing protein YiiM